MNVVRRDLEENTTDRITTVIKVAAGLMGPFGGVVAELIGSVIPNQRTDRLVRFVNLLNARLTEIEVEAFRERTSDPEFVDVVEDSLFQAARGLTENRLEYIANVMTHGITHEQLRYAERKRMLWLLQQLNDEEIVLLRGSLPNENTDYRADAEFQERHSQLLRPIPQSQIETVGDIESNAIRESYEQHLRDLGLMSQREGVSVLGRMLLRYLDLIPDWYRRPF